MELRLQRNTFTERATGGELTEEGRAGRIAFTLEDTRRIPGVKVKGSTAIPQGRYKLTLSMSKRFGRYMVMLSNCSNGYELRGEGISFLGIRIHGGNSHTSTEGCLLVAYNRINDYTIQGTAEAEVTALVRAAIDRGEECWIQIED